MSNFK